jgi:NAD(P)H-hydrate epimerase
LIAHPSNVVFVSPIADEALGTAGSGDVLSGVLGALLARSIPSLEAAIIGVFVHGIAGEYLSVFKGYGSSFLASELAKTCGNLLQCLSVYEVSVAGRRDTILPSWIPHVVEFEDLADCL